MADADCEFLTVWNRYFNRENNNYIDDKTILFNVLTEIHTISVQLKFPPLQTTLNSSLAASGTRQLQNIELNLISFIFCQYEFQFFSLTVGDELLVQNIIIQKPKM